MDDTAGGISTLPAFRITHSLFKKPRFPPKQPLTARGRAHTFAARPGKAPAETRGAIPAEQLRDTGGDGTPGWDGGERTPRGERTLGGGVEQTTDPGKGVGGKDTSPLTPTPAPNRGVTAGQRARNAGEERGGAAL